MDVVGIILVIGMVVFGVLNVQDAVAGFGNDIIITIAGLFILVGGLIKTGLVDLIGRRLYQIAGNNEFILTALIMMVAAISASVLKNTTTTAMFLPVVLGLAEKAKIPPSRLLMPMAFGAILGGSCTLIGTSTNLAVSGAIQSYGLEPYSMFELTPVGVITVAVGMIYMLFIGRKLLPRRGGEDSLTEQYHIREYISELLVLPESKLVGKTLGEANLNLELDLNVLCIIRGDETILPTPRERIRRRDLLIVEGTLTDILRVKEEVGLEIRPEFLLSDNILESGETELFEVMVLRDSSLIGRTLKSISFRQTYNLTVLAVNRHGETFFKKLSDVALKFGDVLLVQGNRKTIEPYVVEGEMLLLQDVSASSVRTEKRRWAIAAFVLFLIAFAFETRYRNRSSADNRRSVRRFASAGDQNRSLCGSLFADRFSSAGDDRLYDQFRNSDEGNSSRYFSRRSHQGIFRRLRSDRRACRIFRSDGFSDTADVESSRRSGRHSGRYSNGGNFRLKSAHLCRRRDLRGFFFVYHTARTRLRSRLYAGTL